MRRRRANYYGFGQPSKAKQQARASFGGWARLTKAGWQFDFACWNGSTGDSIDWASCSVQTRHFDVHRAAKGIMDAKTGSYLDVKPIGNYQEAWRKARNEGTLGYLQLVGRGFDEVGILPSDDLGAWIFETPPNRLLQGLMPAAKVLGTAQVRCSGRLHKVSAMSDGNLRLDDHPDLERQALIDSLKGEMCPCRVSQIAFGLHLEGIQLHGSQFGIPSGLRKSLRNIRADYSMEWRFVSWRN